MRTGELHGAIAEARHRAVAESEGAGFVEDCCAHDRDLLPDRPDLVVALSSDNPAQSAHPVRIFEQ
jgi:hypothetical protein